MNPLGDIQHEEAAADEIFTFKRLLGMYKHTGRTRLTVTLHSSQFRLAFSIHLQIRLVQKHNQFH